MKVLITAHLVHLNARSVPLAGEEALALAGKQHSTGHDTGPRASKSSSSPEEPNSRILRRYSGAKGSKDPDPFHIKPMAHTEEKEMSEEGQRKSRLSGYTAKDNPVLGKSRSRRGKSATPSRAVSLSIPRESPSVGGQP